MHLILASLVLLAGAIITLFVTRRRLLIVQIVAEILLLLTIGGFQLLHGTAPLPPNGSLPDGFVGDWLRVLAVAWWLIAAKLAVNITGFVRGHDPRFRDARLFAELIAAIIYIATVLIILNSVLNLPVSGLLATSGVIAIVLGLALQNTLADVFSGIAVGLERPFHLGDRVSLGDNVEGVIVQINWRSIRIQTDGEDLATIPNSIVAKGQIINRSVPTTRRAAAIEIVTLADVRPEIVIELMRHATLLCPNVLTSPAPSLTMRRLGLKSATYDAAFFVADSSQLISTKSMLLKQIHRVLHQAGVRHAEPTSPVDLLTSLVIFEPIPRDDVEDLAGKLTTHVVEPGEVIFEQGSAGTGIYIIASGVMEIVRHDPPLASEVLGRFGAGDYIGELGLITGAPRSVTMTALTHGCVLELPGKSLTRLLESNVPLNAAMEKSVRKGLALLDHYNAARATVTNEDGPDVFARIKAFFRV